VLEDEAAERRDPSGTATRSRKRYKVVLHSSPFLRCIQTSIAISAGLAQNPTPLVTSSVVINGTTPSANGTNPQSSNTNPAPSPRARSTFVAETLRSVEPSALKSPPAKPTSPLKSVLRLDAFLGEWLTQSYFEHITPPPESVMMLASAKADLLRREDYMSYPSFTTHVHSNSQPQLWGSGGTAGSRTASAGVDGLDGLGNLATSLPRSDSASSQGSQNPFKLSQPSEPGGYVAPVTNYAVSSTGPIPMGHVAHARDACVDIDYQWDSMRPPLDWGDGGKLPEEWPAMHTRFRKGIQRLVDWYTREDAPTDMVTKTAARWVTKGSGESTECAVEDSDDVDTEAVVILVSHGAGCNALIGAVTHQAALMDVAMASLTMAVRKPDAVWSGSSSTPVHELFDLPIRANTDHNASTPRSSRSSSTVGLGSVRGRYSNSFSSTVKNFSFADSAGSRSSSASATLTGMRRGSGTLPMSPQSSFGTLNGSSTGITVGSGMTSFFSTRKLSFATNPSGLSRTPTVGLWSPIIAHEDEEDDDDDYGVLLDFSHEKHTSSPPTHNESQDTKLTPPALDPPNSSDLSSSDATPEISSRASPMLSGKSPADSLFSSPPQFTPEYEKAERGIPQLGLGLGGLWGAGVDSASDTAIGEGIGSSDLNGTTKRRWTVNERV
jgi:hypothetical protein